MGLSEMRGVDDREDKSSRGHVLTMICFISAAQEPPKTKNMCGSRLSRDCSFFSRSWSYPWHSRDRPTVVQGSSIDVNGRCAASSSNDILLRRISASWWSPRKSHGIQYPWPDQSRQRKRVFHDDIYIRSIYLSTYVRLYVTALDNQDHNSRSYFFYPRKTTIFADSLHNIWPTWNICRETWWILKHERTVWLCNIWYEQRRMQQYQYSTARLWQSDMITCMIQVLSTSSKTWALDRTREMCSESVFLHPADGKWESPDLAPMLHDSTTQGLLSSVSSIRCIFVALRSSTDLDRIASRCWALVWWDFLKRNDRRVHHDLHWR